MMRNSVGQSRRLTLNRSPLMKAYPHQRASGSNSIIRFFGPLIKEMQMLIQAKPRRISAIIAPMMPKFQTASPKPVMTVSLFVNSHRSGEKYEVKVALVPKGFQGMIERGMGASSSA